MADYLALSLLGGRQPPGQRFVRVSRMDVLDQSYDLLMYWKVTASLP